jgi:hypothetical protein
VSTYPESLDAAVNSAADAARASIAAAGLVGSPAGTAIDAYVSGGGSVVARKSTLPLNALEYGATGDGSTDDTAALQAWLDAAVSTRRAAYLPRGRYKITASLTVSLTDATKWQGGVRIYGDGSGFAADGTYSGSVLEPTNAVTDAALVVTGVANTDNSNKGMVDGLTVQDLGIRGVSGGTNGHGIRVKYLTNATFRNLKIAYCQSGIKIERQANGATYGYANSIQIENLHAVVNRGYGIEAADAGAICGMTVRASNFGTNTLGGIKIASAPATLQGNIYTGNVGPALLIVAPTGASQATGPTMVGEHFETNSTEATSDYSTSSAQVVIESAQCPRFLGCNWLGGNGAHDIKAGHTAGTVTGLTMVGGSHTGKLANTYQTVLVAGANLLRSNVQDIEAYNYRGSSSRSTAAQMFWSTSGATTYAHLAQGQVINGALTASNGVATVIADGTALPLGAHAYFEISSQGGSVYAYGMIRRSHDGASVVVQQVAASADCSLSVVSGSPRVTQTNTSSLLMYWSLHIVRTL